VPERALRFLDELDDEPALLLMLASPSALRHSLIGFAHPPGLP
jgi:hypothetical protein